MRQAAGQRGADPFALDEAARIVSDVTDVDHATAVAVVAEIHRRRKPRNLAGLVRSIVDADEIGSWLREVEQARASPPCAKHGRQHCATCRSEQIGAA